MRSLSLDVVARARLHSLLLDDHLQSTPADVARWFGAMQAQEVGSGLWSLGVRLPGSTQSEIEAAFESHSVVRTWPMRGTVHIVPAEDVRWMLAVTGARTLSATRTRHDRLQLDVPTMDRACELLDAALAGGSPMTRGDCLTHLQEAGISTDGQRGYHLLWYAAHQGVLCIGPNIGSQQTFVRLADWAPHQVQLTQEEGVTELALRFVRSHGPVSDRDFAGWTGLTLSDSRAGLAANTGRLTTVSTAAGEMWVSEELAARIVDNALPSAKLHHALPGFDELVLGYKDRSAQVPEGRLSTIVPGGNGMFRATVVAGGRVVGVWTKRQTTKAVKVDYEPFEPVTTKGMSPVLKALQRYADFVGRELSVGGQATPD